MREEYDRRRAVLKALEILQSVSTAIYVPPEHARTRRIGMNWRRAARGKTGRNTTF